MTALDECFKNVRRDVRLSVFVFIAPTLADSMRTTSAPFYKNTHFFYRILRWPFGGDRAFGADQNEACRR